VSDTSSAPFVLGESALSAELLRLVTCGSVDDGKSTLIGRLLYDTKQVMSDQLEHVEETSERRGDGYVNLALLTDGLRAEREQGITIDVASWPTRRATSSTRATWSPAPRPRMSRSSSSMPERE
jgi:translation elongation factor EF-1alpha